jgi:hypothetical protein
VPFGKVEGGVWRCFIMALSRSDRHVNKRGAWAPQVASSRKTKWGENANMSGGGDPGYWRTCPAKQRSRVVGRAGEDLSLKHVKQGIIGTSMWQGRSRHITQGELETNDISRVIMKWKAQMNSPSSWDFLSPRTRRGWIRYEKSLPHNLLTFSTSATPPSLGSWSLMKLFIGKFQRESRLTRSYN